MNMIRLFSLITVFSLIISNCMINADEMPVSSKMMNFYENHKTGCLTVAGLVGAVAIAKEIYNVAYTFAKKAALNKFIKQLKIGSWVLDVTNPSISDLQEQKKLTLDLMDFFKEYSNEFNELAQEVLKKIDKHVEKLKETNYVNPDLIEINNTLTENLSLMPMKNPYHQETEIINIKKLLEERLSEKGRYKHDKYSDEDYEYMKIMLIRIDQILDFEIEKELAFDINNIECSNLEDLLFMKKMCEDCLKDETDFIELKALKIMLKKIDKKLIVLNEKTESQIAA